MDFAVSIAVDLMQLPAQTRNLRSRPLPDDVAVLLQIASGDEEVTRRAAETVSRTTGVVREAAEFYVIQILLAPDADSYRVLGSKPGADAGELRRNMALLLRWLHPDLDPKGERSIFASRVTRAWNDVKTPERRAAYNSRETQRKPTTSKMSRSESERSTAHQMGTASSRRAPRTVDPRPASRRLSRVYTPRPIGFLRRLLIHLLGRPIL
jgi:hypothetical protein